MRPDVAVADHAPVFLEHLEPRRLELLVTKPRPNLLGVEWSRVPVRLSEERRDSVGILRPELPKPGPAHRGFREVRTGRPAHASAGHSRGLSPRAGSPKCSAGRAR